jgi:hypothetical protein
MHFRYYHTPPKPVSNRLRCPVCHQDVYSRGDIHPQCAFHREDARKLKDKRLGDLMQTKPAAEPVDVVVEPPIVEPIPIIERPSA